MITPWYIALEPFGPSAGQRWTKYVKWSGLTQLTEIVSFDQVLCPCTIRKLKPQDWQHNVDEDYVLFFFRDLDYLLDRVAYTSPVDILAAVRSPDSECRDGLDDGRFDFKGYDVVDVCADISALTNCGGFPNAFRNEELNEFGLLPSYQRAVEVNALLRRHYPDEHHTQCHVWALWRMTAPPARRRLSAGAVLSRLREFWPRRRRCSFAGCHTQPQDSDAVVRPR